MPCAIVQGMPGQLQSERDRRIRLTALLSLYALAPGAIWSPPLVQLAQFALFALLAIQVWTRPKVFMRSALFWVTAGFVCYVVVRGIAAGLHAPPDLADLHFEGMRRWIKAGPLPVLCVAIGFALIDDRRLHIRRIFLLFVIVFTIDLLLKLEPGRLWAALDPDYPAREIEFGNHGRRYIFGLHFAFTSLLYALVIMGLLAFGIGGWLESRRYRVRRLVSASVCGVLLLFFLTALVAGGARTSWIATLAGITAMGLCWATHGRAQIREGIRDRPLASVFVLFGLVLSIGLFGYAFGGSIAERLSKFGDTPLAAIEVTTGERTVESLPGGPVGDRLAYYAFGLERLREQPLFGYGPGRPRHLVFQYEAPRQIDDRNSHLHSQYVDVLLRFGTVGFVLLVSVFAFAFRGAVLGWSRRQVGGDYLLFMTGALTVYAIWSLSDQRFTNYTMVAVVSLILGSGASFLFPAGGARVTERDSNGMSRASSLPPGAGYT